MSNQLYSPLKKLSIQDLKHSLYLRAVQSPELDVKFFNKIYFELNNRKEPTTLREDFCGTFALSCEWVKLRDHHKAIAIDIHKQTLNWGRKNHLEVMDEEKQKRLKIVQGDVRTFIQKEKADFIIATNFSSFFFHERSVMKAYFQNCYKGLNKRGLFVVDAFGGSECLLPNEEETEHEDFCYFWDQESFDPISNVGDFSYPPSD